MSKKYSVRKYIVSTLLVTSIAFSPIMTGSVFANAGSAPSTVQNESSNEQVQSEMNNEENETTSGETGIAIIEQGEQGPEVTELQKKLNNHGKDVSEDGIYGNSTQQAVVDFQSDQGWNPDGVVDAPTLNALDSSSGNGGTSEDINGNNDGNGSEVGDGKVDSEVIDSSETIKIAQSLVGTPYVWGGKDPSGFDSSGFINYVYGVSGTHQDMWNNSGVHVNNPAPGDVVFFEHTYEADDGRDITHSGVYLGNKRMIHSGGGSEGVSITTAESWDYYWANHYIGAKRF